MAVRRSPLHSAFAALLPLTLATPSAAQVQVQQAADLVLDLAYDKCPAFLDGKLALQADTVLTAQGFSPDVKEWNHPTSGRGQFRNRETQDLLVTFGGASGTLCQLSMVGKSAPELLKKVRGGLERLPYKLEPDASRSGVQPNGAQAETLRAIVSDHELVFVQFITAEVRGRAMASFQIKDMRL